MYRIYEIKMGETINSIANKLNISPDVLATINGLNISTNLTPGTYIVVPNEDSYFDKYVVKKGDTIYQIAQNYQINPRQLLQLNGLDDTDYIYPNQEMFIPKNNVEFFVTSEGDTLNNVLQNLNTTPDNIARQNQTIYLVPDQLIVYKK